MGSSHCTAADRAMIVRAEEQILAANLAGALAKASVVPMLEGRDLRNALISATADRRGYCSWTVDHASWVVTLAYSEEQALYDAAAPSVSDSLGAQPG